MKNVVVEIDGQYAVVLSDAGDFKRISNINNLKIGDVFVEKAKIVMPRLMRAVSSIAAVLLIGFMASFYYFSFTPQGFIDVRINPGIKLTLNAMDKVIGIEGLNDDGRMLLASIAQKESDPRKAVEMIVSKAVEMGFFKEGNPVRITVAMNNEDKVDSMETTLMEAAQNTLKTNSVDVPVSAFSIDINDYKKLDLDRDEEATATPTGNSTATATASATPSGTPSDSATSTPSATPSATPTATPTTDYSSSWKEKTLTPSICDVKFSGNNIIIELNHNLTLDNAKVYAYSAKDPSRKLEAKVISFKNDKLTISFDSLTPGETYKIEAVGITNKNGILLDPITAKIIEPVNKTKGGSEGDGKHNNGNGYINGSNNGNYKNEDGKGNGKGLDEQKGNQSQIDEEGQQDQEQLDEQNQDQIDEQEQDKQDENDDSQSSIGESRQGGQQTDQDHGQNNGSNGGQGHDNNKD